MIIKSHIRGGYRSAAEYLKEQGLNETTRLVEISDPSANNLDEAFHNMWVVADNTHCKKPLHHISINPMKGERLTDAQVLAIVRRCEEKYGYKMFHHQRVIVEHVKDGRQHFHVIWNRVSLMTGKAVWPGHHWKKSKQVCREMEVELGLQRPVLKRTRLNPKPRKGRGRRRGAKGRFGNTRKQGRNTYRPYSGIRTVRPQPIKLVCVVRLHEAPTPPPAPVRPLKSSKGWPPAAVSDWEVWGNRNPSRFFALWPELS